MNGRKLKIIDGSANSELVISMASYDYMADSIADIKVSSFSDGESEIEIRENMRGCDVFVVQPTSPPANDHLIQLCLILDALKRSNCWRVTAVIPYFGYARQDKKLKPRVPISAKAVADMIQVVGVDRILTMDLHSNQTQGYFDCPVDNLFASSIFLNHMRTYVDKSTVIVSPDVGGVARAVHYSKELGCSTAIIHKTRYRANEVGNMVLLGSVRDKTAIIVDDLVDTAGTLCKAADVLKQAGANRVIAYASHGVFSGNAFHKIFDSEFDIVYVTDSIRQEEDRPSKIQTITCAGLLAEAILNVHNETSVSCLFA
jgi:ribose-phosphate pyrophosphokinase